MSKIHIIKIKLPVPGSEGPYRVLIDPDDATNLAWFITETFEEECSGIEMVPTPLPRPLQLNEKLLLEVAKKISSFGYDLAIPQVPQH